MLRYTNTTIGTITIQQGEKKFKLQIRQGNYLAVIINVSKTDNGYLHTLYSFIQDEQHLKNLTKHNEQIIPDKVVSIRLNMRYKESATLLKYMVKQHQVVCYYK